jgi:hypothetical protein
MKQLHYNLKAKEAGAPDSRRWTLWLPAAKRMGLSRL